MKVNSNIVNLGVKGNSISRTVKACRKEFLVNTGLIATSLPVFFAGVYFENLLISGIFGTSAGVSIYDTHKAIELYSKIKPEYKEIKNRAKSIYRK